MKRQSKSFLENPGQSKFTIFSFVDLKSEPFVKIKKKNGYQIRDNLDVHVGVTNLETMTNFNVKFTLHGQFQTEEQSVLTLRKKAEMELNYINTASSGSYIHRKMQENLSQDEQSSHSMVLSNTSIVWNQQANFEKSKAFYRSRRVSRLTPSLPLQGALIQSHILLPVPDVFGQYSQLRTDL